MKSGAERKGDTYGFDPTTCDSFFRDWRLWLARECGCCGGHVTLVLTEVWITSPADFADKPLSSLFLIQQLSEVIQKVEPHFDVSLNPHLLPDPPAIRQRSPPRPFAPLHCAVQKRRQGVGFPRSLLSGCELFCSFQQAVRARGWGSEETVSKA